MRKAFTFIEVLVTMGIMSLIFGGVLSFLIMSDNSWQIGRDKLHEQQQARIAIDNIANSLQLASPRWEDAGGNNYTVSLATSRIDFYIPRFYPDCCPDDCPGAGDCLDAQNLTHEPEDVRSLARATYKLNPSDLTQLLKKEGTAQSQIVAHQIDSLSFNCGCSGCSSVDDSCPFVDVLVTTQAQTQYTIQSTIALRNRNLTLSDSVEVEEPEEGEF